MKLEQCAKVSHGLVLSRFQTMPGPEAVAFSLYTMKEMSDSLGFEYHGSTEKLKEAHISKEKAKDVPVTRDRMVLINLTSHRAVAVRSEHEGLLIPSNFAVIEPNEDIDAGYLEWYFNEHPYCLKQLRIATQGAIISALSIQMLRSLIVEIPSIQQQQAIRNIYLSIQKKKQLMNERIHLEEQQAKQLIMNSLKEEAL